jgi:hypothetical protein
MTPHVMIEDFDAGVRQRLAGFPDVAFDDESAWRRCGDRAQGLRIR